LKGDLEHFNSLKINKKLYELKEMICENEITISMSVILRRINEQLN